MAGAVNLLATYGSASATWAFNPTYSASTGIAFSGGNNTLTFNNASQNISIATSGSVTGKSSGKWYWEIYISSGGGITNIGVESGYSPSTYVQNLGADANGFAYFSTSGGWWAQNSLTFNSCGTTYWSVTGNVIGLALDAGSNQLSIYLNNSLQCTKTISGGNYFPALSSIQANVLIGRFTSASWTYSAPSGYSALN